MATTAILLGFCTTSNPAPQPTTPIRRNNPPPSPNLKPNQPPPLSYSAIARTLYSYVKSGQMEHALTLFHKSPHKAHDAFLWNAIIRGHTNSGQHHLAIQFYYHMLHSGIKPDHFTFPFLLKSSTTLEEGLKLHARLVKTGLHSDLFIGNSLVAMYSRFGLIASAERVFDEMPDRDVVSWNSMVECYVANGEAEEALSCFREMQGGCQMRPDRFGVMSALEACSLEVSLELGKQIHCYAIRHELESDVKIGTSLLGMYCKCGNICYAERLFGRALKRNVVAWNVMIGGYSLNHQSHKAVACAIEMQAGGGIEPDAVTMVNLLLACANIRGINYGKAIHGAVTRKGLTPHLILATALVDMYAKCGKLRSAKLLFERMDEKSIVSWNIMLTTNVQNGQNAEGLKLFLDLLQEAQAEPDAFTISSIVPAFAELASLRHAKQIHGYVVKSGNENNTVVLNSIMHMYARCGDLQASRRLFDRLIHKDVASWNTIIMGHAIHGLGRTALKLLSDMKRTGLKPNESTFVSVLSACSISGLVEEGWRQFSSMQQEYNIAPQIEHYGCMVDLQGRAGDLEEAVDFIEKMPLAPTARIWGALLTASRNRKNIKVAEFAAERISSFEHDNTGCYVLLSNMYADTGRREDLARMRSLLKGEGLLRTMGRSLVELGSKTCSFINGDKSHSKSYMIHKVLDILNEQTGENASSDSSTTFDPLDVAAKRANLPNKHSVRLALAFGLISSTAGSPILVKKNIRICEDCHNAINSISRFTGREIIVGDSRIYHHVINGLCCCGDYW